MRIVNGIIRLFEVLTIIIGGIAYLLLLSTLMSLPPAPQLAAASATFAALVIIPYCMARMMRVGFYKIRD